MTTQALAQAYPTRSITMIVPFAAGGPTDVIARIVTGHMAQTLGRTIIIENVVGAGGTTATARAARAANDGYTLITGHMGTHAASVPLYPKLASRPEKDFEPVGLFHRHADPDPGAQGSAAEGSPRNSSPTSRRTKPRSTPRMPVSVRHQLLCELLNSVLGVKPIGVPFNGTGPAMNTLVAGQVDYMCDQIVNEVPQINGRAR